MLLTSQQPEETEVLSTAATGVGSVEELRRILTKQERREVAYSEAQEVGASLIEFYQLLAEEVSDDSES
jgi:hypothetical protein